MRCSRICESSRTPCRRSRLCSTWTRPISRCAAISRSDSSSRASTDRSSSVGWDSGCCREERMTWREAQETRVDSLFGLARNSRLKKIVGKQLQEATVEHERTERPTRVFAEVDDKRKESWARARRVVARCEYLDKGENPRSRQHRPASIRGRPVSYARSYTARAATSLQRPCSPTPAQPTRSTPPRKIPAPFSPAAAHPEPQTWNQPHKLLDWRFLLRFGLNRATVWIVPRVFRVARARTLGSRQRGMGSIGGASGCEPGIVDFAHRDVVE
jgi:hypothetical protein